MADQKDNSQREANRRFQEAGLYIGRRYVHYKGGKYEVRALSLKEDTLEPLVTYRSLAYGYEWTRRLENFLEEVDGKLRFHPED